MGNTRQLKQKLTVAATARSKDITPAQQVRQLLEGNKNRIKGILPKVMPWERMANITFNAVRTNPKLLDCTEASLLGGIIQSALLGLELNTPQGHAWLIPFYNSRAKVYECQFITGYKGMIQLARRSGDLGSIAANVVREGDLFEYEHGLDEKLRHIPAEDYDPNARLTHAYAYAKLRGGFFQFCVMPEGMVLANRNRSQGYRWAMKKVERINEERAARGQDPIEPDTPWVTHEDRMWAKTAVRRLYTMLPNSPEMARVDMLEGLAERGQSQELGNVLDGDFEVVPEKDEEPAYQFDEKELKQLEKLGFVPIQTDQGTEYRDQNGTLFNRDIHLATDDGSPAVGEDGAFVVRQGGGA